MRLTAREAGGVVVVVVDEPSLDRGNRDRFREALAAHLRPGVRLALDLDRVRHIDGPGYGALLALHNETADRGGQVSLCSLRGPVRALFQRLRLHRKVRAFNHADEAARSLRDSD
jgi:anti-anti-sigma factor